MNQQINCYNIDGSVKNQVKLPNVLTTPIRKDIIDIAFKCMSLNGRQPYAVSPQAGMQHSAHGWGTGRAVARVPRVSGSGTRRSGQGAFANFCRKGRLAHPTNTHRRLNRKFNLRAKRHAVAMALAATAVSSLVESRGHVIENVKQLPLVLSDEVNSLTTTKEGLEVLKKLGLADEIEKVEESRTLRPGKGKMRNRRYKKKKGILILHTSTDSVTKQFRNISGVDLMCIDRLSLLELAPGGHLGRLVLWTEDAINSIDAIFENKKGYVLPERCVSTDDVEGIFYSEEVQSLLLPIKLDNFKRTLKDPREIEKLNSKVY